MVVELEYFTRDEINEVSFGCDNGFDRISIRALAALDSLRRVLGRPLKPTCAFRTVEYDQAKGRSGNSQHCKGTAFDIYIKDLADACEIIAAASKLGFKGFAINLKKKFVHIDMRESTRIATWNY